MHVRDGVVNGRTAIKQFCEFRQPRSPKSEGGCYHFPMVTPEMLEILRCPMDPKREARLVVEEMRLLCSRCRLQFRIREGFPSLLVEEATLPDGISNLNQLPCQRK
jgi:uncharacterized protein YbaR (Trm112 family)